MSDTLKILTIKNSKEEEILRKISHSVSAEELKSEDFKIFLDRLLQTAVSSEKLVGVQSAGISAPQVGKNIRVFYILNRDGNNFELFINPEITILDMKQEDEFEGCLSVPEVEEIVPRYKKLKAVYLDKNGNRKKKIFKGIEAREIQHEIDHLDGILFIDRIN